MERIASIDIYDDGHVEVKQSNMNNAVVIRRNPSRYARFFDSANKHWVNDPEYNLMFLRIQQRYANDILKSRRYIFLNEVYEMLGLPRTKAGAVVGWIYDENNEELTHDNFVDFGLYSTGNVDFVNGHDDTPLLDFNVDGIILDKI